MEVSVKVIKVTNDGSSLIREKVLVDTLTDLTNRIVIGQINNQSKKKVPKIR